MSSGRGEDAITAPATTIPTIPTIPTVPTVAGTAATAATRGTPMPAPAEGAPRHRVVVFALAPVIGFDLTIPSLVFGAARDEAGHRLYDVVVAGLGGRPVPTAGEGYAVMPAVDEAALAGADTVIVPGTRLPGARESGVLEPEVAAALDLVRPGARLVSICTGAFVLAAAGRLDGRPATTHWAAREQFERLYPRVRLDPGVLFVDDGGVLTSAGLAAGLDLCLYLVRSDHGARVANRVARHAVVPPWREGGQAQFIENPVPPVRENSTAAVREWALAHLDADLDVPALAARAGMSVRTLTRHFRRETGQTPAAWVLEQRSRRARELLEETDLPMDAVAHRAGLGSAVTLRAHLQARIGVSPSAYRATFRGRPGERAAVARA